MTLLDGKIQIEKADWLIPVIDKYPALEAQYTMLEPEKVHHNEGVKRVLEGIRTEWLAIAYEVRTRIIWPSEDIFIPELSF